MLQVLFDKCVYAPPQFSGWKEVAEMFECPISDYMSPSGTNYCIDS